MASADQDNLGRFFYEPAIAAQVNGVMQENQTPMIEDPTAFASGLQLGSGLNAPMLDVATPCTFTPAVIVVTSLPAMYIVNSNPTPMGWIIKELMESHARTVSGIDVGYTLSTQDAPVGHDGQTMKAPGKTTRNASDPSFTFSELGNNIVWSTFKRWIWDINHPDTNAGMANVVYPGAWTMSAYAASFMAIQFDPTMRPDHIIDAVQVVNVFPMSIGDLGIERNIGQVKTPERTVGFSGLVLHNDYIKSVAITIAEQLALHKHNYSIAPPYRATIDKNIAEYGLYTEHQERMAWSTQEGVSPLDTTGVDNVSDSHQVEPQFMSYEDGVNPYGRTDLNWNQD